MEIVSVEECASTIVVNAEAVTNRELALDTGWASVTIAALDKPVEFDIRVIEPFLDP